MLPSWDAAQPDASCHAVDEVAPVAARSAQAHAQTDPKMGQSSLHPKAAAQDTKPHHELHARSRFKLALHASVHAGDKPRGRANECKSPTAPVHA